MSEHVFNCALALWQPGAWPAPLLHSAARGPGTPGGERALWTDACRTFFLTAVGHAARPQSSDLEVPWKSSGGFHSLSFSLCQFAETMRGFFFVVAENSTGSRYFLVRPCVVFLLRTVQR